MRRTLLAATFVTAATAGIAPPAHAVPCAVLAEQPQTSGALVWGTGHLACAAPAQLTLTVCVEVLRPAAAGWVPEGCSVVSGSGVASLRTTASACYQDGPALVRIAATGTNPSGTWYAASGPAVAPGAGSCGP